MTEESVPYRVRPMHKSNRIHEENVTRISQTITGPPMIRCFRCSNKFPVTDFLHTKKSGVCIPCWEKRP